MTFVEYISLYSMSSGWPCERAHPWQPVIPIGCDRYAHSHPSSGSMKDFGREVARTGTLSCPHPHPPVGTWTQPYGLFPPDRAIVCWLCKGHTIHGLTAACWQWCRSFLPRTIWQSPVPPKPSPLPVSLAMDFCHLASLHGSYGTKVIAYCFHTMMLYDIPDGICLLSHVPSLWWMKNRQPCTLKCLRDSVFRNYCCNFAHDFKILIIY